MIRQITLEPEFSSVMVSHKFWITAMGFPVAADELSFTFEDDGKKASLCIEGEKAISIDKGNLPEIWNELMKLNFTKILHENENNFGLDGYELAIRLRTGLNQISVILWCPSESAYEECGKAESAAFMNCVNRLIKLAADNDVEVQLDCE